MRSRPRDDVRGLDAFLGTKVAAIKGKPTPACPQSGADIVVSAATTCLGAFMTGGTRTVRATDAKQAVEIVAVPAQHDSSVPRSLLGAEARKALEPDSHVNEAGTVDGEVRPGSRTAAFVSLVKGRPVYLAISGKALEFSGEGKCVAGC